VNWKLIFLLSLFGIAMAFAGVFGISGRVQTLIWLIILIFYAVVIVRQTTGRYFLHAFTVSVVNGIWIGIIQAAFISAYLRNHHIIKGIYKMMPLISHRRVLMVIMGLLTGAIMGLIAGLIAFAAGKIMKKTEPPSQS